MIEGMYPRLVVDGADAALAFYGAALGAQVLERYTDPDGRVVHAMLQAGPVRFAVKDADSYDPVPSPGTILALEVSDADAVAARMVDAGATVVFPVADQPYGERGGRLRDPFGHQWMVSQRLEDLTPEEVQARTDTMFA
jgi:PhnB protein